MTRNLHDASLALCDAERRLIKAQTLYDKHAIGLANARAILGKAQDERETAAKAVKAATCECA